MPVTILGYPEHQESITLQTSRRNDIPNGQNRIVHQQAINNEVRLKEKYGNAEFQGAITSVYNCHGLTFASKRTGIFDDSIIELILKDEYTKIERHDVIIGDIVVYFSYDNNRKREFDHSAIVVSAGEVAGAGILGIKVLSKTRFYREIVHYVYNHPYTAKEFEFYRIKHEPITIL